VRSTRPFATEESYHRRGGRGAVWKLEVLTFALSGEEYGVDIQRLREIVRVRPITEVPRAPEFVLGVIGVRGEVLPVLDLRRRLRLRPGPAPGRDARVLIVKRGAEAFGLQVDAVRQVVRLREEDIEATPPVLAGGDSEFIAGIGRPLGGEKDRPRADRLVILLALDAVLRFTARGSS
jgi:purine-binding chemotaxis protein CheW